MNKVNLITLCMFVNFLCGCTAQQNENPQYLEGNNGSFDLDRISFNEDLNILFSKVPHNIIADKQSHYDKELNKEVVTDTVAFIYRVQSKARTDEMFNFGIYEVPADDVVSFYQTKDGKFGYVSLSIYLSETELENLLYDIQKRHEKHSYIERDAFQNSKLIQYVERHKKTTISYLTNKSSVNEDKEYYMKINIFNKTLDDKNFYDRYDDYKTLK